MSFESFQQPASHQEGKESLYDSRLQILWDEYDFPGRPPRKGSVAEKRLHEKCSEYADLRDEAGHYNEKDMVKIKTSDIRRRQLHNEIAIMTVGQKRSGMEYEGAENIAEFAYEYVRGLTFDEAEKIIQEREKFN